MKEYPILFTPDNVRAILAGNKTQTRRVVKPQPDGVRTSPFVPSGLEDAHGYELRCPYGAPGDVLWVKETHTINAAGETLYRADWEGLESVGMGWKSPRFMRRSAARLILCITEVRVERLQDISEDDAIAEGAQAPGVPAAMNNRTAYARLWDSINGKSHPWDSNPWVWVITFEVKR